jgi:hypothetical protein
MKQGARAKSTSHSANDSAAGFSFSNVGSFADKAEYVEKDLVFSVHSVEFQAGRGFEGADRWAVIAEFEDRTDEVLTFSCNEKRDEQLSRAQAHIEAHGPIPNVRLKRIAKAYYLETVAAAKAP